jgi:hypothetical protein
VPPGAENKGGKAQSGRGLPHLLGRLEDVGTILGPQVADGLTAQLVDRHGDLVAANDGFGTLAAGVAPELLAPPVNVPRVLLHPQGMAPRIINLDEWAWHVIDRLHQEVLNNPNGRLDALVSELEALVPDRPRQPGPDYLGFAVPLRLRSGDGGLLLLTTLTHFGTAVDVTIAELRLEAFLPADEETAARLEASARGSTPAR